MTTSFYSVDRRGFYREGATLNLMKDNPFSTPFWELDGWFSKESLREHLYSLYPDGLSFHGWQYLLDRHDFVKDAMGISYVKHEYTVEILFEYYRKSSFPSRASRFQSFFAWQTIEEAQSFAVNGQPIYRVECEEYFKADQNLLTVGVQNIACSFCAHRYWKGEGTHSPKWEILLIPPVYVVEQVGIK